MKTVPALITVESAWAALVMFVVVCGCSKGGNKPDTKSDAQFQTKLEAIRQAGEPVTLSEWNAWYAEPPAGENAATIYAEAFAALAPVDASAPSFLERNQRSLELLHQAAAKSQCRYPVDLNEGVKAPLPHLPRIKTCAQLLKQEADVNAGKGRTDLAAQSVIAGLRLARSLKQEPLLISQLTREAVEGIVVSGLEQAMNRRALSEEQLALLQEAFGEAEGGDKAAVTRCLAGERCAGIALFQMTPRDQSKAVAVTLGTDRNGPTYSEDRIFFLDQMNSLIAAAGAPFPNNLELASHWSSQVSEAQGKGYVIAAMLLPSLAKTLEKSAANAGDLRAAQAALAVERYRLAHANALPDSLSELVPQYLIAVPADPFDGNPLRYRKSSPKGYSVYSIGADREDDGGTPKPAGAAPGAPYDLTFTVRR